MSWAWLVVLLILEAAAAAIGYGLGRLKSVEEAKAKSFSAGYEEAKARTPQPKAVTVTKAKAMSEVHDERRLNKWENDVTAPVRYAGEHTVTYAIADEHVTTTQTAGAAVKVPPAMAPKVKVLDVLDDASLEELPIYKATASPAGLAIVKVPEVSPVTAEPRQAHTEPLAAIVEPITKPSSKPIGGVAPDDLGYKPSTYKGKHSA